MIIFQSISCSLASLLLAIVFLLSVPYAGEADATRGVRWQSIPALKDIPEILASLPPTAKVQASDEPFGFLSTIPVSGGYLTEKWRTVIHRIKSEASVLSNCAITEECPTAARRFLEIVAEGRAHQGLARVGVINRAVNLSIIAMSDMKQWGVTDRWSSPLETLTTGRGDCEDYAIVKYAALLDAGIRREDLKLVIVHDLLRNEDHAVTVAHVGGKWIVLDNRWLALVQDVEVRREIPLFVLDDTGIQMFLPEAGATSLSKSDSRARLRMGELKRRVPDAL